jgi:hypothetical protein
MNLSLIVQSSLQDSCIIIGEFLDHESVIQNSIDEGSLYHDDDDLFNRLMELILIDASNPIHEWMERVRSTVQPELDEESPETDALIHSSMVTGIVDPRDLQRRTGSQSVSQLAWKNISDSHKEKRKTHAMGAKRQSTRLKGMPVRSNATTEDENSTTYQEYNDSSTRTSSDDGNDGDDTGGGTASLAAQGGHERSLSPFTIDQFTHWT